MKNFFAAFILVCAIVFLYGCGDDTTTGPGGYQYTQIDSLFKQVDYDSVYGPVGISSNSYYKIKVKKFSVSYDLYTNDTTDSTSYMSFNVSDGIESYGNFHLGHNCNGHFEIEHTFNKVLDSISVNFYTRYLNISAPNGTYLLIKNLKAYKSY